MFIAFPFLHCSVLADSFQKYFYIYTLKTTVMKTFELKIKSWHFASFLLCQIKIKIEVGVTFVTMRYYNFQFLLQHVNVFKKKVGVLMGFICSRYNVV